MARRTPPIVPAPDFPPVLPPADIDWSITVGPVTGAPSGPGTVPAPRLEKPKAPPGPGPLRLPSFCAGAESIICGALDGKPIFTIPGTFATDALPGPDGGEICRAVSNGVCLVTGVFVLFALLGLSINALIRS